MERAAVVLCAGQGTRMKSEIPKVLHPIWGQPMGAWAIKAALHSGASRVVTVVGHQAERVTEVLKQSVPDIAIALQAEQNGTGHAVKMALPELEDFQGTVLVLCGDTPCLTGTTLEQLCLAREETGAPLALATAMVPDPTGYGRIVRDMLGRLVRIVEQKDASADERQIEEINTGVYAFDAEFLRDGLGALTTENAQGEFYLTDLIQMAAAKITEEETLPTLQIPIEEALGVNDRVQLAEAGQLLRAQILHYWMENGVSMIDPATTYVDATVHMEQDVTLGAHVSLRGRTSIASHTTIDAGSILTDTQIGQHSLVHSYSICEGATVGDNVSVGPFARLRPDARLSSHSKIGNFVEVKKATLGEGAKANHLAYIGDAEIGAGSNIGAGTITCNYDGFGKNKTVLGDNVFVGSNSTLVAPMTIGAGAYVAAGSTINKAVESDDLAIARVKQDNKKGYAAKIRSRFKKRKEKQG